MKTFQSHVAVARRLLYVKHRQSILHGESMALRTLVAGVGPIFLAHEGVPARVEVRHTGGHLAVDTAALIRDRVPADIVEQYRYKQVSPGLALYVDVATEADLEERAA